MAFFFLLSSLSALDGVGDEDGDGGSAPVGVADVAVRTEAGDDGLSSPICVGTLKDSDIGVIGDTEPLLSEIELPTSPVSLINGVAPPLGATDIAGVPGIVPPGLGGWGVENGAGQTLCLLKHS